MTIIQKLVVDQIEVTTSNVVQVRMANQIIDNSQTPPKVLASEYQRHVVVPGQDYSEEEAKVRAICESVHTPEVVAQYQAEQAAQLAVMQPKI